MVSHALVEGLRHLGLASLVSDGASEPAIGTAILYAQITLGRPTIGVDDTELEQVLRQTMARDLAAPERGLVVRGYVRAANGAPLANLRVQVFDRDLRHAELLGTTTTDGQGRYELAYEASQFVRSEKPRADLVVHAARDMGPLLRSPIEFDAPVVAIINLAAGPLERITEWTLVSRAIMPVLDGVAPPELTDDDLAFLIREAKHPREAIEAWVHAHRFASALGVDAMAVYGCLRQRIPADPERFAAQPAARIRAALADSAAEDVIAPLDAANIERLLAILAQARLTRIVDDEQSATGTILAGVFPDRDVRSNVRRALARAADADDPEVAWRAIEGDPVLAPELPRLRDLADLIAVTGLHPPLLAAMRDPVTLARWEQQEPWTLRALAAAPRQVVTDLVATVAPPDWYPGDEHARRAAHAAAIERELEHAAPTQRLAARLRERPRDAVAREVAAFLEEQPAFDLRTEPVARFLRRTGARLGDAPRAHLRTVQRLHRLAARFDEIDALMETGTTTALRMARVPPAQHAKKLEAKGIADQRVHELHIVASRSVTLAAFTQQEYGEAITPLAIAGPTPPPDLAHLLGKLDLCACAECAAADGPAAYFVDLMHLLEPQPLTLSTTTKSPYQLLVDRRPDLASLPLSCHHTLTPLPAIDLVNEQLEALVTGTVLDLSGSPEKSAAELRARPQYVNGDAYQDLETTTYPPPLPFELGTERVRAALDILGCSRGELLAAAPPVQQLTATGNTETDDELATRVAAHEQRLAREQLRIPKAEASLLSNASASLASLFGIDDAAALANVATLLAQTGLTSDELHALVERDPGFGLTWPDGCDATAMTLGGATEPRLRLLGQYVRLRRRLGWPAADLDAALDALGFWTTSAAPDQLLVDLARLAAWRDRFHVTVAEAASWLAAPGPDRTVNLARALGVRSADLPALLVRFGVTASADSLALFLAQVDRAKALRLTVADLVWLTDPPGVPAAGRGRTDAQLAAVLHSIVVELARANAELDTEATLTGLARLLTRSIGAAAAQDATANLVAGKAPWPTPWPAEFAPELEKAATLPTLPERTASAIDIVKPHLRVTLEGDALAQALSRALDLERKHVGLILNNATLRDPLLALRSLGATHDVVLPSDAAAVIALRVLERFAFVVNRFASSDAEITAMTADGPMRWVRVTDLASGASRIEDILQTGECAALRRSFRSITPGELVGLLSVANDDGLAALTASQGAAAHALDHLKGVGPFTIARAAEARRVLDLRRRFGAAADLVFALAGADVPVAADGTKVLDLALAQLPTAERASREPVIHDRLRVARRDALLAHLSTKLALSPTDLTNRLLLDVETSACQLTSRVKAAIGSVQLFIHRSLMGHEPGVLLVPELARWWRWMQNFRVWQANRKVFLYPENWIEPELRDDKTPIFADLESTLSQQDVTQAAVDEGFRAYLRGLHDIARLEIIALHHEQRSGGCTTIHLVGRQWSQPRGHYYRQRIDSSRWTPWEKVDADIEGDHVMVTVHNGRPTIIWPLIREERDPGGVKHGDEPPKRQAIRFFWTERAHGRWGAKRSMDPQTALFASASAAPERSWFFFRADGGGARLRVEVEQKFAPSDRGLQVWPVMIHLANRLAPSTLATVNVIDLAAEYVAAPDRDSRIAVLVKYGLSSVAGELVDEIALWTESGDLDLAGCGATGRVNRHLALNEKVEDWFPGRLHDRAACFLDESDRALAGSDELRISDASKPVFSRTAFASAATDAASYRVTADFRDDDFATRPFAFQSSRDTFLLESARAPFIVGAPLAAGDAVSVARPAQSYFRVSALEHPHVCELMKRSEAVPLVELLSRQTQAGDGLPAKGPSFIDFYQPKRVVKPYPMEGIDFSRGGAYAVYNWELFFHAPFLLAVRLMQNERYEEALTFLHVIFDPTASAQLAASGPSRFWKFLPFHQLGTPESVTDLLAALRDDSPDKTALAAVLEQLDAYREDPFNPHLIARLRPGAYMRAVLMRYLDCLIGWGDKLFRRETLESLNQATMLYLLASELLGPRPRQAPSATKKPATVAELLAAQDALEEALEDELPAPVTSAVGCGHASPPWPVFDTNAFCVPNNPTLLAYWDTVADRLFKIRHCQNLEGRSIQLPLFEPPIDPALLVRAAAAGVDIGSVLDGLAAPLPSYRFGIVSQKALELCNDVKALGSELLSILEKRDAESLARLRAGQEVALLDAVRAMKQAQLAEATQALRGLERQRETVELRRAHYQDVLQPRNEQEKRSASLVEEANKLNLARGSLETVSGVFHALVNTIIGTGGFNTQWGLPFIGAAIDAAARGVGTAALAKSHEASKAATEGSYLRRSEEWGLQGRLAASELKQLEHQIAAAEIRVAMAERDLTNHDLQRDNAREVEAHLRAKFTSRELFDWMAREASNAYRAAFRMAYDMARRAERCFRFERGAPQRTFIGGAHWDDLRQGLLAGTRLHHELRQMEVAYLDENRRDLEITRHVSLSLLDGLKLFQLRATGACDIELPETLFDADYPGHYLRRLKSVAITVPAVVGAHASVSATLTLMKSQVRSTATADLVPHPAGYESIVTSSGQNDSGLFEANLRDERYLPFEGAGAISTWRLELPAAQNSFDLDSLTDVILHLRYTARDGGPSARAAAEARLKNSPAPLTRLFSIRHDFATAWAAFTRPLPPPAAGTTPPTELVLDLDFTPFAPRRNGTPATLARLTFILAGPVLDRPANGPIDPDFFVAGQERPAGSSAPAYLRLYEVGGQLGFSISKNQPTGISLEVALGIGPGGSGVTPELSTIAGTPAITISTSGAPSRPLVLLTRSSTTVAIVDPKPLRALLERTAMYAVAEWAAGDVL
ncbi:MAG: hypothetical protein IPH44_11875 [Myxococcales bacterium]|nr:hypothetical protein [Myxococcales bacterium]MBK7195895.1 hypothetical protein [Myxococcales bacterium]